jgi:ABC-type nitrate/sulfonate/bicarbonate transport system permease component
MSFRLNGHFNTRIALSICGAFLIPVVWWGLKAFANIPDFYLPSITSVFDAARTVEPNILYHAAATTVRLLIGFVGGTVLGIAIAVAFARWPRTDDFLSPSVHALRAVPAAATVPFFLLWFGFAETGRYLLVLLAVGLNVAIASHQILANHSRAHLTFFHSFELAPGSLPLRYSLPRIVQEILPTLRYSLALAVGAVTVSELLGAQVGLGYLIQSGRSTFSFNLMFLAMIAIGLIASGLDALLRIFWQRLVYWRSA